MHRLNSGQGKRLFSICPVGALEQNEATRISHAVLVRFKYLPSNFVPVVLTCSSALEAKTTLALSEKKRGKLRMEGESEFSASSVDEHRQLLTACCGVAVLEQSPFRGF